MSFFDRQRDTWRPEHRELSPEQVTYYQGVLLAHCNQGNGACCQLCGVRNCEDWRGAFDQLAIAGQVMTEPRVWTNPGGAR